MYELGVFTGALKFDVDSGCFCHVCNDSPGSTDTEQLDWGRLLSMCGTGQKHTICGRLPSWSLEKQKRRLCGRSEYGVTRIIPTHSIILSVTQETETAPLNGRSGME